MEFRLFDLKHRILSLPHLSIVTEFYSTKVHVVYGVCKDLLLQAVGPDCITFKAIFLTICSARFEYTINE